MKVFQRLLDFSTPRAYEMFLAAVVFLTLFCLCNLLFNEYSAVNGKLRRSLAVLRDCVKRKNYAPFDKSVPSAYRFQWETFCKAADKRSDMFRFQEQKRKIFGKLPLVLSFVLFAICVLTLACQTFRPVLTALCVAYVFCFLWLTALISRLKKIKKNRAEKLFDKYVRSVSTVFAVCSPTLSVPKDDEEKLLQKIDLLVKSGEKRSAQEIARILNEEGFDRLRTVDQQRRLNAALSSLTQLFNPTR